LLWDFYRYIHQLDWNDCLDLSASRLSGQLELLLCNFRPVYPPIGAIVSRGFINRFAFRFCLRSLLHTRTYGTGTFSLA